MADNKKTFHEWALESILFKGRQDWYFCYIKAERIAHVLALLNEKVIHEDKRWFVELLDEASDLPHMVAHLAAGDVSLELILGDVFSLISRTRLCGTRGFIAHDTSMYIAQEYEQIAERLTSGTHLSPFVSPQDFSVPDFLLKPRVPEGLSLSSIPESPERPQPQLPQKRQQNAQKGPILSDRRAAILHFVLGNNAVSIREIHAAVPDCSEKTIQRELNALIAEGHIKREGERRWSVYKPA